VASLIALSSTQDEVAHILVSLVHVFVVVASKLLLVPCCIEEGHVSSFLELVDRVLLSLLIRLLVVGFESR